MKKTIGSFAFATIFGLAASTAMATPNLVTNGSFESGLAGWSVSQNVQVAPFAFAHDGNNAASTVMPCFGPFCGPGTTEYRPNPAPIDLVQVIDTVPGAHYDVSFWAESLNYDAKFSVRWNDVTVFDVLGSNHASASEGLNHFTIDNLVASTSRTKLDIIGDSLNGVIYIDDVSVTGPAAAAPEPGTLALLGLGLAGAAAARRKRVK